MIDLTGYKLTFDDEFNRRSISQSAGSTTWGNIRQEWRFDANSDIGFGSSSFVDAASGYDPFVVAGGALTITARPDQTPYGYPGSWESGLITTQGSFSQTYGYFEIRADFAGQKGAWDAFWLLPNRQTTNPNTTGGWQELDIVEHYGDWDKGVYSTIHTTDPQNGVPWQQNRQVYSELADSAGYHTYGVDWQADQIRFYVDGQFVGAQATPSDLHAPMFLLANLAVQTKAGGNDANAAGVPIQSSIDYIRVYSKDPAANAVALDTVSAPDGSDPGLYGATVAQKAATSGGTATSTGTSTGMRAAPELFGTTVHDVASAGGQVYALYEGLLGRAPDPLGLQTWSQVLKSGTSASDLAQSLLTSAEGRNRTNALDNGSYVEQLYGTTLHRHSDAPGLAHWTSQLDHGVARAQVALNFAFSQEHVASLKPALDQGVFVPDAAAANVARLYYAILDRAPDAGGLSAWTGMVRQGAAIDTVTQSFLAAPESQAKTAGLTNAQYVDAIYQNALGRHAETAGLANWTNQLDHGASRVGVATSIGLSGEAQQHHLAQIETGWYVMG